MRRCAVGLRLCLRYNRFYNQQRLFNVSALRLQTRARKTVAVATSTNPAVETLRYERKSPIEHILLRPDTYVGSTALAEHPDAWVVSEDGRSCVQMPLTYSPALLKIFDEILVNAADNKQRDPAMDELRVDVDQKGGKISIFNNGRGLPIEIHPIEGIYVPTLIFGNLFTSSNYDDKEVKVVGGRNGYGAKLCNIFSKEFVVETSSHQGGKTFRQVWTKNMREFGEPVVVEVPQAIDGTRITFRPDLAKFGVTALDDAICKMFRKRTYDVAGTLRNVSVYYNGKLVEVPSFREYVNLYSGDATGNDILYVNASRRWQWAVKRSTNGFQQISFVNNIATTGGGKHVDHIADQIVNIIKPLVDPNLKSGIKKVVIKNHLCTFVNALIENPAFSSQTKDVLTTSVSAFGSKCVVDATAVKEWAERSGLIEDLTSDALAREGRPPRKSRKAAVVEDLSDIVKLEDANWAGNGDRSEECRLLITEGDSAKALAVAGLEVVGRDRYGVFPIMGKLTNVSGLTEEKANSTKEISHLIRILGLKYGTDYSLPKNRKTLRYGGIIILTDQDEDGSHIKGLIINFLHTYWPQLLRNGFVQSFMTPLLKARRGSETISFYSMKEFNRWKENTPDADKFTIKYYKGLGTSTSKEAREYFSHFEKHLVQFRHEDDNDDLRIRLVFDKRRSDDRKRWISERLVARDQEVTTDAPTTNDITYKEFVDNELFRYSLLDLRRSIPSVVDGLKPSQRKVIHTLLRRSSNKEIKVSQLAAAVALNEGYHHGEASLVTTIVRLAQDFVGMNNVCLLEPLGQFGTRHEGGDDAASARYIYTKLTPITRLIFPSADDELLHYLEEENQLIEPEWYCPIIPMILINGAEGIATGWSTRVLSHDINKVIDNVRRLIEGEEFEKMTPSFSDFSGSVQEIEENRFEIRGKFSFPPSQRKNASNLCIEIVELPVGEWTNRYKQNILHPLQTKGLISGFKEYHTERQVRFVVELSKEFSIRCRRPAGRYGDLMKIFKLSSVVSTNSMVLFDSLGHLKHYTTVSDIMKEHFQVRRQKYEERKEYETRMLDAQLRRSENQLRFVEATISGDVRPHGKHLSELESDMRAMGFEDDPVKSWKNEEANLSYLMNMPLSRLTIEEVEKLQNQVQSSREKLNKVTQTSWQDSWLADLQALEK
ncbi:hypothetical protein V3C99_000671, partial [Haemonchus contortus]